ncbi:MAG: SDR family oxidoreductase [Acidimicrobiia bacterium]|nr:SDR family oxidoreductase [Acidimicrobiia bacterium]
MPAVSPNDTSVIVITGASRGIGAAVARRLAADAGEPTHLIINYAVNRAAANAVVAEIEASGNPVVASAVQADVGRADKVENLFAAADEAGTLTGLVNNAAVVFPIGPFVDLTPERLQRSWAVNITGAFLCAREAVLRMSTDRGGRGGSIVNVSSRAASFGSPNEFIDYAASKGALDSMTRGLSTEVAAQGIRVNAVRPGLIDTDLHTAAGQPDRVNALAGKVPMRRGGTADEVANLIVWMLSDEASYMTGALVDIGGGR